MEEGDDGGDGGGGGGESRSNGLVVRWERLLPRMAFRVLLVEADDSTRQIIAALLRKCSYRVAAVPDGLKAWELLKERPHNIDLILTEENLPSISGYALLTLIMEHEICKNIPVIMMSKEDSISTVYKCMMRGAADYLVKPIRRNELRNLWQHVWRRHSQASRDNLPQDESVGQDRAEGASENNAASNHSTDVVAFVPKNKEDAEKDSDSQRSCMVVDVDDEGSKDVQDGGSTATASEDGNAITPDNIDTNADTGTKVCSSNSANFTGEEIDFMGAAPPHQSSIMDMESELDSCSNLDLSLRSYRPDGVEVQEPEEENTLRHSSSSFFTRYTGRKHASVSEQVISSITDTTGLSYRNISVPVVQVKECKNENAFHEQNVVCTPRPQSPCSANRLETPVKASDSNNAALPNEGNVSQSENSSLCDAAVGHHPNTNSTGYGSACGSNSDAEQGTMIKAEAAESNVREVFTHVKTSQREAALAKFRLKRKDRCYDKKVRYESRKMLAEKRPRVKGQFVRQVPAAAPLPERR
ncbi:Two-component response regulator-like APRR5 [Linum grandiflorum]